MYIYTQHVRENWPHSHLVMDIRTFLVQVRKFNYASKKKCSVGTDKNVFQVIEPGDIWIFLDLLNKADAFCICLASRVQFCPPPPPALGMRRKLPECLVPLKHLHTALTPPPLSGLLMDAICWVSGLIAPAMRTLWCLYCGPRPAKYFKPEIG